jgi:hypothetical protein
MSDLNGEIREVEQRIARGRNGLAAALQDLGETARDTAVSPKSLLTMVAAGYLLGELGRPSREPQPAGRKAGLAGLLVGAAAALLRARYGSPWALAQLAVSQLRSDRNSPRSRVR